MWFKEGEKNAKSLQCDNDVVTKVRDVTINLIFGFFMHDQWDCANHCLVDRFWFDLKS